MHISHACFKKEGQKKEKKETKSSRGGFSGQIHRTRIAIRRESWNKRNRSRLVDQIGERMENKYNHRCRWFAERERKREREKAKILASRSIDRSRCAVAVKSTRTLPARARPAELFFKRDRNSRRRKKAPVTEENFERFEPLLPRNSERKMLEREFEPAVIVQQRRKTSA